MRLLYLVTSAEMGGAQRYILINARRQKSENEVWVAAGKEGWLSEEIKKEGISFFLFKTLRRSLNPIYSFLFAIELRKFIKEAEQQNKKIDIVHFNGSNAAIGAIGLWGLRNKPRTIFTIHGLSYLSPGFKKSRLAKFLARLSMKMAIRFMDEIIFVCNYDLEMAKKLKLIKREQGKVIYNEIEPINFLSREDAIKELKKIHSFPDDKIIIGTITRLEYAKNNEMLVKIIAGLPQEILNKIICLIIGDGPEREKVSFLIQDYKMQDKIILMGEIPNASIYLKAFDIFVMTSRYEGMPYALLEAKEAKLPIIATKVGGISEILKNGILVDPDDIKEFIREISDMILDREKEKNRGEEKILFSGAL